MTNAEIIKRAAIINNIFTEEQVQEYAKNGERIPLHTYIEWKKMGYQVKKGEHATISLPLWKFRTKKDEETGEIDEKAYMQTAYLFTDKQVEKATACFNIRTKEEIKKYNAMLKQQRLVKAL